MADTSTTTHKPADWSSFPEYQDFWNAFVDIFWGEGGNTSYHDMIMADQAYLKDSYMKNYDKLNLIENTYLKERKEADLAYEQGMDDAEIEIRFGGQKMFNMTPRPVKERLSDTREHAKELSGETMSIGGLQSARDIDMATKFTPHGTDIAYMNSLAGYGNQGQAMRGQAGTTTQKGPDGGFMETGLELAGTGLDLYKQGAGAGLWGNPSAKPTSSASSSASKPGSSLMDTLGDIGSAGLDLGGDAWDAATDFGSDAWDLATDWGTDFWDWLTT